MRFAASFAFLAALALAGPAAAETAAHAHKSVKAGAKSGGKSKATAAKPSGPRKPGELEGWSAPEKGAKAAPEKATAKGPSEDGGLPLPQSKIPTSEGSVGYDDHGNLGTGFKF
ncbi:MAG: hypothetical protein KGL46_00975 [Hyphomicrobiales bacterium]|nr:hypothetical protein [Hyphomicrobiales bacterium]